MVAERSSLSADEFFAVSRQLEQYHSVFYKLWELGKPVFDSRIPTAAVQFDKQGNCINFLFNPTFWDNISEIKRAFVVCHECLHVILNHGIRMKDTKVRKVCNIALDVVVNHILLDKYGFHRKEVDESNIFCWLDTVFPHKEVQSNRSFEYYFNQIDTVDGPNVTLVDSHDHLDGSEAAEAIDKLNDSLTDDEKESIKNIVEKYFEKPEENADDEKARTEAGSSWHFVGKKQVKKKPKWETVIKRWSQKFTRTDSDVFEHWIRLNRRIVELPEDVILPTDIEVENKPEKGKANVYFFMDSSGSCASFAARFFHAAESLSSKKFNIYLFCFDTRVYKVSLKKRRLYGFGGTRFDIMEQYIQEDLKKKEIKKYPEGVFVLSDGISSPFTVQDAKRWYWFLTERHRLDCIPRGSHVFKLTDFE